MQVTQNLASRVKNTHAFDIPCIWLPAAAGQHGGAANHATSANGAAASPAPGSGGDHRDLHDMNSLPKLCDTIAQAVTKKVQDNMERAEKDCSRLLAHLEEELVATERQRGVRRTWGCYTWLLTPALVLLGAFAFLDVLLVLEPRLPAAVRDAPLSRYVLDGARPTVTVLVDAAGAVGWGAVGHRLQLAAGAFLLLSTLVQFFRCRMRGLRTRSGLSKATLLTLRADVDALLLHVESLHTQFSRAPKITEFE